MQVLGLIEYYMYARVFAWMYVWMSVCMCMCIHTYAGARAKCIEVRDRRVASMLTYADVC